MDYRAYFKLIISKLLPTAHFCYESYVVGRCVGGVPTYYLDKMYIASSQSSIIIAPMYTTLPTCSIIIFCVYFERFFPHKLA